MTETEVFRLSTFDPNLNYAFALKTKTVGKWPNEKHYTTYPLQYLGKFVKSARWGWHDIAGGSEQFDDNGKITEIIYDYEGRTCFTVVNSGA
jgi:hypothetical protein